MCSSVSYFFGRCFEYYLRGGPKDCNTVFCWVFCSLAAWWKKVDLGSIGPPHRMWRKSCTSIQLLGCFFKRFFQATIVSGLDGKDGNQIHCREAKNFNLLLLPADFTTRFCWISFLAMENGLLDVRTWKSWCSPCSIFRRSKYKCHTYRLHIQCPVAYKSLRCVSRLLSGALLVLAWDFRLCRTFFFAHRLVDSKKRAKRLEAEHLSLKGWIFENHVCR